MEVMDYDETAQMEVMDENGSTKICKNPKSKYPLQVYSATGVYTEGRMIVCGGTTNVKSRLTSACYSYEDDQQGWTKLADMNTQRSSSSSIKIPGGILVTGGFDGGSKDLKTSEIIFINGTVKQGKELPEPRSGHCMVEYQGQIISTGGLMEMMMSLLMFGHSTTMNIIMKNKTCIMMIMLKELQISQKLDCGHTMQSQA